MASLTRLSILIAESDVARGRELATQLRELGVQQVSEVSDIGLLGASLRERAFDVLLCAERLGNEDGVALLRWARNAAPATRAVLLRTGAQGADAVPSDIEALELPASRLALQALLQQTASPHGGLWCEVPALSLSDILQMYHQARRSVTVLLSGPIAGRVRLESGEIVDAEMGEQRGVAALSRLLEAESGLIRTAPAPARVERTIDASFQSVLLEAAQQLDERRRAHQLASAHQLANEPHQLARDTLRVPTGAPIPALPGPFQAHAPDPTSFLLPAMPAPRRRSGGAWLGVLLGGALAAGAAFYVQHERPRRQPAALDLSAQPEIQQAARALKPSNQAIPAALSEPPAPAPERAPTASASDGFTLHLASKPSRATVIEAGKVLGKTPLDVEISASSVAKGPRRFTLRHTGYVSSRLVQPASNEDVDTTVLLQPRATANAEPPDAGHLDAEATTADRDIGSSGRRRELNIRSRR